ncbi:MAG: AraC family transcriptional regulator [Clostridia bacterium]|nr:AraC family transcriptional regulator [Clostridia bacterium]
MDWIQSLNKAIGYMEDHLLDNLTCEDIAGHVYISSYHFQRGFSLLTGITVGEYIRNRRLSLAGQELILSDIKVIDVALKYGYETPESFTKAFTRFHGVTPSQAKLEGSNLKSFNRLIIKIRLEGGTVMDYKIINRDLFRVFAMTRLFKAESSFSDLPKFWSEYYLNGYHKKVCGMMGVCEPEKSGCDEFRYGIGREYAEGADIPDGYEVLTIPANTWAVFRCVGPMPDALQEVLKRIYSEWLPQAEYERIQDYDLEMYTEGDNQSKEYISEIWMPVKKK